MNDIELLVSLDACTDGVEYVRTACGGSLKVAWRVCKQPTQMCWLLRNLIADKRKQNLLGCRLIRETPLGNGRKVWDLLTDERSRNFVEIVKRFEKAEATGYELYAAKEGADQATLPLAYCSGPRVRFGFGYNPDLSSWLASDAVRTIMFSAERVSYYVICAVAHASDKESVLVAQTTQCYIIREMFSWKEVQELIEKLY